MPNAKKPPAQPASAREARTRLRIKLNSDRYARAKNTIRGELTPGFLNRLLATIRSLDNVRESDFTDELYVTYLAAITATAPQTVRRWVNKENPGLPDLISFATLCKTARCDANWLLGLSQINAAPSSDATWLQDLVEDLGKQGDRLIGIRADGDEMDPIIRRGEWVLVDTSNAEWGAAGIYAFQHNNTRLLRQVEIRIGTGFVLSCANSNYEAIAIRDETEAKAFNLKMIGRVTMKLGLSPV